MAKKKSSNPVDAAVASESQFGRKAVGNSMPSSARNASGSTGGQKQVKKGNSKGGSPDNAGTANHRSDIAQERLGPRFSIGVALPGPESPEAHATQGNGRIVPSVLGSKNNFSDQTRVYGSR